MPVAAEVPLQHTRMHTHARTHKHSGHVPISGCLAFTPCMHTTRPTHKRPPWHNWALTVIPHSHQEHSYTKRHVILGKQHLARLACHAHTNTQTHANTPAPRRACSAAVPTPCACCASVPARLRGAVRCSWLRRRRHPALPGLLLHSCLLPAAPPGYCCCRRRCCPRSHCRARQRLGRPGTRAPQADRRAYLPAACHCCRLRRGRPGRLGAGPPARPCAKRMDASSNGEVGGEGGSRGQSAHTHACGRAWGHGQAERAGTEARRLGAPVSLCLAATARQGGLSPDA